MTLVGRAAVCKTAVSEFDSHRGLQYILFNYNGGMYMEEKDYTFLGQQIDIIVDSIKNILEFYRQIGTIFPGGVENPYLDQSIELQINALWNFILKEKNIPDDEFDDYRDSFGDCIFDLASGEEIHGEDENGCFLSAHNGKMLLENFFY